MNSNTRTGQNVVLSDEVITKMVSVAAMEIEGVCSLVPNPDIKKILAPKSKRIVEIHRSQNSLVIDMYVKLKAGVNIVGTCNAIQENVKKTIQNMTGNAVSKVNVFVVDIDIPTEE